MEIPEYTLEWLLGYDGRQHIFTCGHFVKFDIKQVEPSDRVPHGISYSFTFHDPDGKRLLGYDNAHPVQHPGGKFVKGNQASDHWHRTENDPGRPYNFESAEKLVDDFWAEVEKLCKLKGISTEPANDKEV